MTIDEFVQSIDFPEMKLLGEMKHFRYYWQKELEDNLETGIPIVIEENKKKNTFKVLEGMEPLKVIDYFYKEK